MEDESTFEPENEQNVFQQVQYGMITCLETIITSMHITPDPHLLLPLKLTNTE